MRYIQNEVMYERVDDIGYIIREVDGVPYLDGVISLNEVAADVWEFLKLERERQEIEEHICAMYDITPDVVSKDIDDILKTMLEQQIIRTIV